MTEEILTFVTPPVRETVLSVAFDPIPGFTAADLGRFWSAIASEYPEAEELPYYDMPIEVFESESISGGISIKIGGPPSRPRVLFYSKDHSRVCQLQNDWFAVNWRQNPSGLGFERGYQRYGRSREEFSRRFSDFRSYVNEVAGCDLLVRQCEVSYINHVSSPAHLEHPGDTYKIFKLLRSPEDAGMAELEHVVVQSSQRLVSDGAQVGRLHSVIRPERTPNGPVLIFELTARGRPSSGSLDDVLAFLDLGREAIVLNFKSMTTDEIHSEWGLKQ